jgi:tetratricopeptide (TPR) repeat protein
LEIYEQKLGKDHPNVATSLNNLANLYRDTGRYAEAESLYHRSLEIKKKKLGKNHHLVETILQNLLLLYLDSGMLEEAYKIFKERNIAGGLGKYYLMKKDFPQAQKEFSRDLGWTEKRGQLEFIIADHIGLGLAFEGMEEYMKAKEHFTKAIAIIESQWKALSPDAKKGFLTGQTGWVSPAWKPTRD